MYMRTLEKKVWMSFEQGLKGKLFSLEKSYVQRQKKKK